jgi:outer membrane protein insertion porin family
MLRDLYGGEGYIFADIQTNPRFIGDSGELDIVYNIAEGQQYRIGQIYVNIEGDESHTRHDVVLNRLSISPGDIVDVREIRSSERRLQASQLFETNPTQGPPPQIVVKPNENGEAIARDPDAPRSTFRGQSPTTTRYRLPLQRQGTAPVVDLIIQGKLR